MNINKETLMAAARLAAVLITSIVAAAGYAVDADLVYNIITTILAAAAIIWCWWSNNNITTPAQLAQAILNQIKQLDAQQIENITAQVEQVINKTAQDEETTAQDETESTEETKE